MGGTRIGRVVMLMMMVALADGFVCRLVVVLFGIQPCQVLDAEALRGTVLALSLLRFRAVVRARPLQIGSISKLIG